MGWHGDLRQKKLKLRRPKSTRWLGYLEIYIYPFRRRQSAELKIEENMQYSIILNITVFMYVLYLVLHSIYIAPLTERQIRGVSLRCNDVV